MASWSSRLPPLRATGRRPVLWPSGQLVHGVEATSSVCAGHGRLRCQHAPAAATALGRVQSERVARRAGKLLLESAR